MLKDDRYKTYILAILLLVFICISFLLLVPRKDKTEDQSQEEFPKEVITEEGNVQRFEYYDEAGNLTCAFGRNYAILIRTKDEYILTDEYFDVDQNPVEQNSAYYAYQREYNDLDQCFRISYLGIDGKPTMLQGGYSIIERTFYDDGSIEDEFYLDVDENPVAIYLGQYGLHREYDEEGRCDRLTYLGPDGKPMVTSAGYASVKYTFYSDNSLKTESYYDLDGNPVALSEGQYGTLRENGKIYYIDANGRKMFNLRHFLYSNTLSVIIFGLILLILSLLLGKKFNMLLLFMYILFIVYMTLMNREEGTALAEFEVFWSYKQFISSPSLRVEILNNIWLFIPLGLILYKLCPKAYILLIPFVFSILIELVQYVTGFGLCELDDVISNGLGGLIGYGVGVLSASVKGEASKFAKGVRPFW
ncbi:MAG: VanZ family protein [Eubacterium sp.]|nr:VanZ family protein [Eubacterium sp.]